MTLNKLYIRAVIYPAILAIILVTIYVIFDNVNNDELMPVEYVVIFMIAYAIAYSLLLCGLSTTLIFNKYKIIRNNLFLSAISWFLIPLSAIGISSTLHILSEIEIEQKLGSFFILVLFMNVPFMVGLIWTFIKYRKNLTGQ